MAKLNPKEILKPTVSLFLICLIVTALLAGVNMLTADQIEALAVQTAEESQRVVLPDAETFETVSVPLRELLSPEKKGEHLLLQFVGSGKDAGVEVRDFELEYRSEP